IARQLAAAGQRRAARLEVADAGVGRRVAGHALGVAAAGDRAAQPVAPPAGADGAGEAIDTGRAAAGEPVGHTRRRIGATLAHLRRLAARPRGRVGVLRPDAGRAAGAALAGGTDALAADADPVLAQPALVERGRAVVAAAAAVVRVGL